MTDIFRYEYELLRSLDMKGVVRVYTHPLMNILEEAKKENNDLPEGSPSQLQSIDLAAIVKAAGILVGEIDLAALLQKIMRIVLKYAGAEKGYLILDKDGELVIEAEGHSGDLGVTVLQSIPVQKVRGKAQAMLASSIVDFAARLKTVVVLDDAAGESRFVGDPYVIDKNPRSVLCLPLVRQGKLTGVLYLENNLVKGAFTPQRVQVLELLAAQMAISLENARLYDSLKKALAELTVHNRILEQTIEEKTRQLQVLAKSLFTGRERQVLELLMQGWSNKEIGRQLSISPLTVKYHLQNLMGKTETGSRTALAVKALEFLRSS